MKRLNAATLTMTVLLMSILTAVGCSKNQENLNAGLQNSTSSDDTSDITTSWADTIPSDIDYDGYTFNIGWSNPCEWNEYSMSFEESSGDIVSEAVYKRNLLTEAKLDISIAADRLPGDLWGGGIDAIEKLVLANDNTYDVYCVSTWGLFKCSLRGYLVPVGNISTLDISNPWWDTELIQMLSFGSSTSYMLNGHINYSDDYACGALFFNKVLCSDLRLEYPYDHVRNGEWTLDKLIQYVNSASDDLNGNGVYDENDRYGLVENSGILLRLLPALDEHVIVIDSEGNADLTSSESFFTKVQKIYDQLIGINNNAVVIVERKFGYEVGNNIFPNGHTLFYGGYILDMLGYRQTMDNDFGVLPYPKYDESQKSYYSSYDCDYGAPYGVPITNSELERTGWIIETMGFYSSDTIYPASININVMTKLVRDDDSAEMLEIIFGHKFYELAQHGSTIYSVLCDQAIKGSGNFTSLFAQNKKKTASEFDTIKNYYIFEG